MGSETLESLNLLLSRLLEQITNEISVGRKAKEAKFFMTVSQSWSVIQILHFQ